MTSPNDSIIICDTPNAPQSNRRTVEVEKYCKRLRSSDNFTTLVGTVYQSPLVHLRRNIVKPNDVSADGDVTVVSTPPAKRRKISEEWKRNKTKTDQSIVVLNDTIPESVVEIGLSDVEANDVIPISGPSGKARTPKLRSLKKKLKATKSPIKNLRAKRMLNRNLRKEEIIKKAQRNVTPKIRKRSTSVNDENRNGQIMEKTESAPNESEDIEVIWISNSNTVSRNEAAITDKETEPFVVDTEPNMENLTRRSTLTNRNKKVKRLKDYNNRTRSKKKHQRPKNFDRDMESLSISHKKEAGWRDKGKLREIVIDGSNVAMGHKHGNQFSEKGLQIVINYFKERGHVVTAFLPQSMRARDRDLLEKLHKNGDLVFTPSRTIGGKNITPYDDRFILEYATKCNGIVVSSDQYRDLWHEKPQWRDTIENRLLTPTFVGDYLMFPEDPLGRRGPKLEEFLRY